MFDRLLTLKADIRGLVSMKDGSLNSDYFDFSETCNKLGIKHLQTNDINSPASLEWIKEKSPDIIFCFGWSRLLKKELLNIPSMGVIGYHPAKLPSNKGRHPLIWALALGLKETGSSFFFMDEGADTGDIVSQSIIPIDYEDNAEKLYSKITQAAEVQLEEIYSGLKNNSLKRLKQDNSKSNSWRKRTKVDGKIDFRMSSAAIYNLVRALSKPYPGAHLEHSGKEIKIWEAKEVDIGNIENAEPGKIIDIKGNSVYVKTGDKVIELVNHEFQSLPRVGEYL